MRGMNMRDMKSRSMDRQKVRGSGSKVQAPSAPAAPASTIRKTPAKRPGRCGAERVSGLEPRTLNPEPSDFLGEEEDLDELEPALLVDQGDGVRVAVRGYDGGGDDGFELPDEAPPGWE